MLFLVVVVKVLAVFSSAIVPYCGRAAAARADDGLQNTREPEVCSTVEVLVLMDLQATPSPPTANSIDGGVKVFTLINYNKLRRFYTQMTRLDGLDLVQFSFSDGQTLSVPSPAISDGLNSYRFVSFHFHWGTDSLHGSVHHLTDGQKFAMELHSVHLSDKYEKIADRLNTEPDRDGRGPPFLVIVILINTIEFAPHNPNFERIAKSLRRANNSATGRFHTDPKYGRLNLFNLIPKSLRNFGMDPPQQMATYYGSRGHRFDGCGKKNNTVAYTKYSVWLVFKEPIIIAEAQLEPFRNLYNSDGRLVGLSPFPEEKFDMHDPQQGKKNLGFSLHE